MTGGAKPEEQGANHDDGPAPVEPGHVMAREHYERMAREAAQEQK